MSNNIYQILAFVAVVSVATNIFVFFSYMPKSNFSNNSYGSSINSPTNMMGMNHTTMGMMGETMASGTISSEKLFLQNMIPHHQNAVDNSSYILTRTEDPEIRTFAQNVINDQTVEIVDMKTWYSELYMQKYIQTGGYSTMMGDLSKYTNKDLDNQFVTGMIEHHNSAISMSQEVLLIAKDSRIILLANNIIKNQANEVKVLQGWLKSKF